MVSFELAPSSFNSPGQMEVREQSDLASHDLERVGQVNWIHLIDYGSARFLKIGT